MPRFLLFPLIGLLCFLTIVPGALMSSLASYTYVHHGFSSGIVALWVLGMVLSIALVPDIYRAACRHSLLGLALCAGAVWAASLSLGTFLAGQEAGVGGFRLALHILSIALLTLSFWLGVRVERVVFPRNGA